MRYLQAVEGGGRQVDADEGRCQPPAPAGSSAEGLPVSFWSDQPQAKAVDAPYGGGAAPTCQWFRDGIRPTPTGPWKSALTAWRAVSTVEVMPALWMRSDLATLDSDISGPPGMGKAALVESIVAKLKERRLELAMIDGSDEDAAAVLVWDMPRCLIELKWRDALHKACTAAPDAHVGSQPCPIPSATPAVPDMSADSHWRVLPAYGDRPFTPRACCSSSTPLSWPGVAGDAASIDHAGLGLVCNTARNGHNDTRSGKSIDFAAVALAHLMGGFVVTIRSPQLARDYRAALVRFFDGILAALHQMLVLFLAVFAHQPRAVAYLLVMLATARHYGRRSEPEHRFLPALAVSSVIGGELAARA